MNKKIALLLIIFMVGTWCVYAEDDGLLTVLIVSLGVLVVGAIIIFSSGGTAADFNDFSDDYQRNIGIKGATVLENGKLVLLTDSPVASIINNPIVNHTFVDITKDDKAFVGFKFSW